MKREPKKKWIKALESGRYKQTQGNLELDGRYCCLGVLCKTMRIDPQTAKSSFEYELLSESFLEKVGLTEEEQSKLAGMNDNGKSFREIAAYIRANL